MAYFLADHGHIFIKYNRRSKSRSFLNNGAHYALTQKFTLHNIFFNGHFFCLGDKEYFARVGPKKYFFQGGYVSAAPNIYNLALRSDDTFVVTFPKSGML